ncbi:unnamed protein product [Amoebophrya sp. A25]|nr:unnamed protein product [Amoebophrya sp. A25]|eukprot:GSA25T00009662001.1
MMPLKRITVMDQWSLSAGEQAISARATIVTINRHTGEEVAARKPADWHYFRPKVATVYQVRPKRSAARGRDADGPSTPRGRVALAAELNDGEYGANQDDNRDGPTTAQQEPQTHALYSNNGAALEPGEELDHNLPGDDHDEARIAALAPTLAAHPPPSTMPTTELYRPSTVLPGASGGSSLAQTKRYLVKLPAHFSSKDLAPEFQQGLPFYREPHMERGLQLLNRGGISLKGDILWGRVVPGEPDEDPALRHHTGTHEALNTDSKAASRRRHFLKMPIAPNVYRYVPLAVLRPLLPLSAMEASMTQHYSEEDLKMNHPLQGDSTPAGARLAHEPLMGPGQRDDYGLNDLIHDVDVTLPKLGNDMEKNLQGVLRQAPEYRDLVENAQARARRLRSLMQDYQESYAKDAADAIALALSEFSCAERNEQIQDELNEHFSHGWHEEDMLSGNEEAESFSQLEEERRGGMLGNHNDDEGRKEEKEEDGHAVASSSSSSTTTSSSPSSSTSSAPHDYDYDASGELGAAAPVAAESPLIPSATSFLQAEQKDKEQDATSSRTKTTSSESPSTPFTSLFANVPKLLTTLKDYPELVNVLLGRATVTVPGNVQSLGLDLFGALSNSDHSSEDDDQDVGPISSSLIEERREKRRQRFGARNSGRRRRSSRRSRQKVKRRDSSTSTTASDLSSATSSSGGSSSDSADEDEITKLEGLDNGVQSSSSVLEVGNRHKHQTQHRSTKKASSSTSTTPTTQHRSTATSAASSTTSTIDAKGASPAKASLRKLYDQWGRLCVADNERHNRHHHDHHRHSKTKRNPSSCLYLPPVGFRRVPQCVSNTVSDPEVFQLDKVWNLRLLSNHQTYSQERALDDLGTQKSLLETDLRRLLVRIKKSSATNSDKQEKGRPVWSDLFEDRLREAYMSLRRKGWQELQEEAKMELEEQAATGESSSSSSSILDVSTSSKRKSTGSARLRRRSPHSAPSALIHNVLSAIESEYTTSSTAGSPGEHDQHGGQHDQKSHVDLNRYLYQQGSFLVKHAEQSWEGYVCRLRGSLSRSVLDHFKQFLVEQQANQEKFRFNCPTTIEVQVRTAAGGRGGGGTTSTDSSGSTSSFTMNVFDSMSMPAMKGAVYSEFLHRSKNEDLRGDRRSGGPRHFRLLQYRSQENKGHVVGHSSASSPKRDEDEEELVEIEDHEDDEDENTASESSHKRGPPSPRTVGSLSLPPHSSLVLDISYDAGASSYRSATSSSQEDVNSFTPGDLVVFPDLPDKSGLRGVPVEFLAVHDDETEGRVYTVRQRGKMDAVGGNLQDYVEIRTSSRVIPASGAPSTHVRRGNGRGARDHEDANADLEKTYDRTRAGGDDHRDGGGSGGSS